MLLTSVSSELTYLRLVVYIAAISWLVFVVHRQVLQAGLNCSYRHDEEDAQVIGRSLSFPANTLLVTDALSIGASQLHLG